MNHESPRVGRVHVFTKDEKIADNIPEGRVASFLRGAGIDLGSTEVLYRDGWWIDADEVLAIEETSARFAAREG